jgi:hypothetical protein
MLAALLSVGLATTVSTGATPPDQRAGTPPIPLVTLLGRAAEYALRFEFSFANVVSEERYAQDVIPAGPGFVGGPRRQHRELVADFLLVRLPDDTDWLPFRDVFEVDRTPIRDRGDRLTQLFVDPGPTSRRRAAAIAEESARYNIGVTRTVNHPLLGFSVLRPAGQFRFKFGSLKAETVDGVAAWVVDFSEQERPTLIRGSRGRDVPMSGRAWIDGESGRILRTDIIADAPGVTASIAIRFELDPEFDLAVPVVMREDYRYPNGTRVIGTASYGRFRHFGVEVSDALRTPEP